MKKILSALIFLSTAIFAEDTYAEHEAKMQQMRTSTEVQYGTGNGEQKKHQYKNGGESGNAGSQNGSSNNCKGSGGGKGRK